VRIISKSKLREFYENEPESETPLLAWWQTAKRANWENFADVRQIYGHADQVGKYTVFNIGGNKYRLVVHIHFNTSRIYIHCVLTHKGYDDGKWKSG
jgi:mRNA interferase HigB